ncbi:MAG TPA: hypothetical protein PKN62_02400 [bacterium]|nr:hypothetical protein [bacterium]
MFLKIKKTATFIGLSCLTIFGLLFTNFIPAQAASSTMMDNLETVGGQSYDSTTGESTLIDNIATLIKTALGLLGFIFVVLAIYAGFLWMTAGGNETNIKKAKSIMTNAVIGLIIIVSAYAVTWFIFANLPGTGTTAAG